MLPGVLALGLRGARSDETESRADVSFPIGLARTRITADAGWGRSKKISPLGGKSLMESIGLSGEIQPTLREFKKLELVR
jgi:hypothetical protein